MTFDSSNTSVPIRFAGQVRSDQLGELAQMLSQIEPIRHSTAIVQATIILDANIIISDLIWLCERRQKAEARSTLLELLECATVKAYAPTYLAEEIENHLPILHRERGIDPEQARREWNRFVPLITFIDVGGPDASFEGVTDPKDVPYVRLQRRLAIPIASKDADLANMGADVIQVQIFGPLRSYSRQRAVEYQIKVVGIGAVFAAGLAAQLAADGARAASRTISNVPKPVLVVGAVGLIASFVHPTSRRWIFEQLEKVVDVADVAMRHLVETLFAAIDEHSHAKRLADDCLAAVSALLTDAGIAPSKMLRNPNATVEPNDPAKVKGCRRSTIRSKRASKISGSSDSV